MIRIATMRLEYDGERVCVTAEIDGEAHGVGLSARRFSYELNIHDDLGTEDGAEAIMDAARLVLTNLGTSLRFQWREPGQPLF